MTTEEQQVPSEEAVLSVQLQENSHTNDGASAIEGTTGNRENSKPLGVTSLVPTINRRESQLSPPQVQEEEPRTWLEVTDNIGIVSPNLVNMVTPRVPTLFGHHNFKWEEKGCFLKEQSTQVNQMNILTEMEHGDYWDPTIFQEWEILQPTHLLTSIVWWKVRRMWSHYR